MNRKWTALLLAMTFILSTVAPTMATAETGKIGSGKTAAVSVEKPKKGKWKLATLVAKVLGVKEDGKSEADGAEKADGKDPTKKEDEKNNDDGGKAPDAEDPGKDDKKKDQEKKYDILFSVQNSSGENLDGAILRIVDYKNHKKVAEWTSGKRPLQVSLSSGKYIINQGTSIEGYKIADSIEFEIGKDGNVLGADVHLKEINGEKVLVLEVEKQDGKIFFGIEDKFGNRVTGAKFQIKQKGSEDALHEWASDKGFLNIPLLPGDYELLQSKTPEGYKTAEPIDFKITDDGKISTTSDRLKTVGNDQQLVLLSEKEEVKKEAGKTFFGMKDSVGRNVAGATLQIRERKSGRPVENATWASEKGMVPIALKAGNYELVQVDGPAKGYTMAAPIAFDINDNGEIYGLSKDEHGNQYLALRVDPLENKTFFSLKDNRGNEIAGVKLQIKEIGTEQVVKEWESGKSPVDVKLEPGEYEFSQINVLPGYQTASPIRFKVADGKIIEPNKGLSAVGGQQVLSLVDGYVKHGIKFRRVKADGKDLAGTTIEIYRDGTKIAYWKSGSEANALELEPGVYRYHEAGIPDGHKKVADFEFEVKTDGTISLGAVQVGDTVKLKDSTIIVSGNEAKVDPKEKPKQQKGAENIWIEFSLTKRSGGELSGAIAELYQGSTMVESWTSTDLSYLTRLQPGTYRFHVKTAPTGFAAPKDFEFTVKEDGSVKLGTIPAGETVTVKGGLITVIFETKAAAAAIAGGTTAQGGKKSNLPKTGDGISPVVYAAAIGVIGAVTLGIGLKKRKEGIDEAK